MGADMALTKLSHSALEQRWNALWGRISIRGDHRCSESFAHLAWLYGDPRRFYHTLDHLVLCFREFDEVRHLFEHPDEAEFALFLHDAIHETRDRHNEVRSLELGREFAALFGALPSFINRVDSHILATTHKSSAAKTTTRWDTRLVIDIDLAILGQTEQIFDAYDANIRREYWYVDQAIYLTERRRIMDNFYGRWPLYLSDHFSHKYGAPARVNLERLINRLDQEIVECSK